MVTLVMVAVGDREGESESTVDENSKYRRIEFDATSPMLGEIFSGTPNAY